MNKRLWVTLAGLPILVGVALTAAGSSNRISVAGWVTDSDCASQGGISRADAECARSCVQYRGAKYVIYNSDLKKAFVLEPQNTMDALAGKYITVQGVRNGDTIAVTSILK
jgi:hypothetical protein